MTHLILIFNAQDCVTDLDEAANSTIGSMHLIDRDDVFNVDV